MTCTCGLFIISNNKLLIVHPTGASNDVWSIPKGMNEEGEEHLVTAFRELKEETGLDLNKDSGKIHDLGFVKYKRRNKTLHGYLLLANEGLTKHDLKCDSYFMSPKYNVTIPEVDRFKWIDPDDKYFNMLHQTQKALFNKELALE